MNYLMSHELIIGNVTDNLYDIAKLMKDFDIGFVPIAKGKKIVGVITDRDIIVNALSNKAKSNDKVEKFMSTNLITIDINSSVNKALELIGFKKVKRLLVTDNNKVVGIISISDLIKDPDIDKDILFHNCKSLLEIYNNRKYEQDVKDFYL